MNTKTLKDIETKNDCKYLESFQTLLKQVVNVPKKEIQEQEKKERSIKKLKNRS
jgi:hypothetical protein